ncbi:MAG: transcriptional regulator GcvA [Proteobacteria bacterium]|nr:transcriptional regulator GcvA [Pseudomonadota bacterium]
MRTNLPPLNALRTFEAAARLLNFSRAADELNVTPSAVSHQIRDLEDRIGIALFRRNRKALLLTEAGQTLLLGVQSALGVLARSMDEVHALTHTPVLTVSVPPSVAMKWLVPRLQTFRKRHPDIDVRISTDVELPNLGSGDVDIAVHYGDGDYPDLEAELLVANSVAPMCSPSLLDADPPLRRPEDLRYFTLLHDIGGDEAGNPAYDWETWLTEHGVANVDASLGLRFNTSADVLNAAVAGAGVAIGKTALAVDDLKSGRLVCLFGAILPERSAYYVVRAPGRAVEAKTAPFRDWLFREFAGT